MPREGDGSFTGLIAGQARSHRSRVSDLKFSYINILKQYF